MTLGDDVQTLPSPIVLFLVLAKQVSFGMTEPAASLPPLLLMSSALLHTAFILLG
jgi:hypothetical protein